MKLMISICFALVLIGCGQAHTPKPVNKDAAIVAEFHQKLAGYSLDPGDLKAIREDLAQRNNPDRQAYLEHLAFADRLLQSKMTTFPPSNPKANSYMQALGDEMFTRNYLQAQPR